MATTLNCDIGERGAGHAIDRELMRYIDIANLACGGHAGNEESVAAFTGLASKHNVSLSAHLSYPDRENFGRVLMPIGTRQLLAALDLQKRLLPHTAIVKFHGALYNESVVNPSLAATLAQWLARQLVSTVITQAGSELALACQDLGIAVMAEAFAERRYQYQPGTTRLVLVNRSQAHACIHDLDQALAQALEIIANQRVNIGQPATKTTWTAIRCATICIHSDAPIALALAKKLHAHLHMQSPAAT